MVPVPKKSKVKEKVHAYQVSFHQWDEVKVERFQITGFTDTTVTYINNYAVEFTLAKKGGAYRWFKSKKRAEAFAIAKLNERIAHYQDVVQRLERQVKKIQSSK